MDAILLECIEIVKCASNTLNELVHKDKAYKRSMDNWTIQPQKIRLYEAGQFLIVLKTIVDKLIHIEQSHVLNVDKIRNLTRKMDDFEQKVKKDLILTLVNKYLLFDILMLALKIIINFLVKCK